MDQLNRKIIRWAIERGIDNPEKQLIKAMEELSELCDAAGDLGDIPESVEGRTKAVADAIGDTYIVVIIECYLLRASIDGLEVSIMGNDHDFSVWESRIASSLGRIAKNISHQENIYDISFEILRIIGGLKGIAGCAGLELESCVELAYDEIKNRKGRTIDGNFIKD